MNFETSIAKSKQITIDGKEYKASVLTISDLNDATELIYLREKELDKEAKRLSLYDTALNLVFNNPQLAIYAALAKNSKDITFEMVNSMNLVGNNDATELVAYLVGIELQKKTS